MPRYDFQPVSIQPPSLGNPFLTIKFRLPSSPLSGRNRDPIYPASGLQVSFENDGTEVFIERVVAREVSVEAPAAGSGSGGGGSSGRRQAGQEVRVFRVHESDIVRLRERPRGTSTPTGSETIVRVHAWQGEKLLGSWEAGRLYENHDEEPAGDDGGGGD